VFPIGCVNSSDVTRRLAVARMVLFSWLSFRHARLFYSHIKRYESYVTSYGLFLQSLRNFIGKTIDVALQDIFNNKSHFQRRCSAKSRSLMYFFFLRGADDTSISRFRKSENPYRAIVRKSRGNGLFWREIDDGRAVGRPCEWQALIIIGYSVPRVPIFRYAQPGASVQRLAGSISPPGHLLSALCIHYSRGTAD